MIFETATIKNDLRDSCTFGALRHNLSDDFGSLGFGLAIDGLLDLRIQRGRGDECVAAHIVDNLCIDMLQAAVDVEPRPVWCTSDLLADTEVTADARFSGCRFHAYLPLPA